ncbi:MAG: hypothetical protein ACTSRE_06715 [Promethearchaeota archaeon]
MSKKNPKTELPKGLEEFEKFLTVEGGKIFNRYPAQNGILDKDDKVRILIKWLVTVDDVILKLALKFMTGLMKYLELDDGNHDKLKNLTFSHFKDGIVKIGRKNPLESVEFTILTI